MRSCYNLCWNINLIQLIYLGKTGAFAVPAIQKVLTSKADAAEEGQRVRALVLAPSRELAKQIHADVLNLCGSCGRSVRAVDLSPQVELSAQRPLLADLPDIVVGTPSRVLAHIEAGNLTLKESLELLVIDEADLIFSFGHEDDVKGILAALPNIYQSVLTSATLTDDVARCLAYVLLLLFSKMEIYTVVVIFKVEEAGTAQSCDAEAGGTSVAGGFAIDAVSD